VKRLNTTGTSRPRWRRVAGGLFVAFAFGFLVLFVVGNLGELRRYEWTLRPGLLVLSLGVNILGLFWGVAVWQVLLRRLGRPIGHATLARVWFVSGLGRYIPGKVWQFVGAAHLGAGAGLPATVTVGSLLVHTGFFFLAALLLGIYTLPAEIGQLGGIGLPVLRTIAPLGLVLAHPAAIRTALKLVRRMTGRTVGEWEGRWIDGLVLVALALVGWTISGVALYLFLLSITPLPGTTLPALLGMNALAFVIGYAVFIAPAGLGAKEGALAAFLSLYVPLPVAALLAVAARLWTVAAEVLPALLLLRLGPRMKAIPAETVESREA
jgi:glycosyltransferase 2 family protein